MFPLKLQLDWLPNAQFAGILVADHSGWYRDEDIDLTILPWQAFTNQMDMLDGRENFVVSTEDNLFLRARAGGKPVKAIGTMMQYSGIGWMSLKKNNFRSLADLKGKRIGIHPDGELAIDIALSHAAMTRKDVDIVEVGFDYVDLLVNAKIDAMQCLMMVEPLEMVHLGYELDVIKGFDLGYEVYSQVIVTTEKLIEMHAAELTRFLKVTFKGWQKAFENPEEVADIIVSHYLHDTEPSLQKEMLLAMRPIIEGKVGMTRLGTMETRRWQTSIDYLVRNGMIGSTLDAEEVMDLYLAARP